MGEPYDLEYISQPSGNCFWIAQFYDAHGNEANFQSFIVKPTKKQLRKFKQESYKMENNNGN